MTVYGARFFCKLVGNYDFTCWFGDEESIQFQMDQIFADSVTAA